MKKFLAATAAAALIISMTACGCSASSDMGSVSGSTSTPSSSSDTTSIGGSSSMPDTDRTDYRIGLGFASSTAKSSAASADYDGSANFDLTACALCVDETGKIIDVRFDSIESGIGFDVNGAFIDDIDGEILSKREQGDDYGMGAVSGIGKEWYQQVDALEEWMRGKTVSEATGMKLTYDGDKQIPDEEDLRSSVTISVSEHLEALEKAYADATRDSYSSGSSDNSLSDSLGDSSSEDYVNESSSSAS